MFAVMSDLANKVGLPGLKRTRCDTFFFTHHVAQLQNFVPWGMWMTKPFRYSKTSCSENKIMFSGREEHLPCSWGNSWVVSLLEAGRIFWKMFTIILVMFVYSFLSICYWLLSEIIWILWRWLVGLTSLVFFWNTLVNTLKKPEDILCL